MIGNLLAHYEITAMLGEGGMGQVYRAHDTKLGRDVAIKVLPPGFSDDPERLARFEREARTLAQLQHPNIASVYGFEQVGEHRFLVMELAEGQNLAERLQAGPLATIDALEIARQIALGVETAHEKGIVHRDLKPANVMLGSDGQVKVLDFGLARAFDESSSEAALEHSPTITAAMTQAGVILGTAAYMSPEQARGRPVDPRTDVWAFGAVLFEMITGKQIFTGEVVSDVIAKILEREPPWEELPADIHPDIRRVLDRCLVKVPKQRLHAIADARIEIESVLADPTGATVESIVAAAPTPLPRRFLPWILCGVLAIAVVALLAQRSTIPPAPTMQFEILAPPGHESREFSVSPDGSALVFVAASREGSHRLWLREFDSTEPQPLVGTEDGMFPFWSPDSRSIGFFARGKLSRIDLSSGAIQTVAPAPNGRGGAWSSDGTILFTPEGHDVLYSVPASGGTPVAATRLADFEATHRFPHFLPGSRRFTFSAHGANSVGTRRYIGSPDSEELTKLPDGMSETYAPPGYLFLIHESTLYAQEFDESAGLLTGDPFPMATGIDSSFPRTARSAFSVSDNGVLAYLQDREVETHFRWTGPDGQDLEAAVPGGSYEKPRLSHDGRKVAFWRSDNGFDAEVWVLDLARGSSSRLIDKVTGYSSATLGWAHDDSSILFADESGIRRLRLSSGAQEDVLRVADSELSDQLLSLADIKESADGSFLTFTGWDPVTDYDLWILHLDDTKTPQKLSRIPMAQRHPRISPNMRWIAYESVESGRAEVHIRSTIPDQPARLISTDGGSSPEWSADGTTLYYISFDNKMMAVAIGDGATGISAGLPGPLFVAPVSAPAKDEDFFSKPWLTGIHGDRFLFHVPAEKLPPRTIKVVLNWPGLLAR